MPTKGRSNQILVQVAIKPGQECPFDPVEFRDYLKKHCSNLLVMEIADVTVSYDENDGAVPWKILATCMPGAPSNDVDRLARAFSDGVRGELRGEDFAFADVSGGLAIRR